MYVSVCVCYHFESGICQTDSDDTNRILLNFLVQQSSAQQKWTILEDNLKNEENEDEPKDEENPKNEDNQNIKIISKIKMTQLVN